MYSTVSIRLTYYYHGYEPVSRDIPSQLSQGALQLLYEGSAVTYITAFIATEWTEANIYIYAYFLAQLKLTKPGTNSSQFLS